jgi:hypothetical protein
MKPEEPEQPREPVIHEKEMTAHVTARASVETSVVRGLTELRLAVLGIVLTIGLSVGFGVPSTWPIRVAAGVAAFVAACALIRWRWARHRLMAFAHWLIEA